MTKANKIQVSLEDRKKRLDVFLSEKLNITRSQAQKLYKEKRIIINNREPKKIGESLRGDEVIEIKSEAKKIEQKTVKSKVVKIPKIKILAETSDYLVVEKPSGLLTHRLPGKDETSLSDILAKQYPEIKKVGDNPETRAGIVHRLDKDASGVLVVARTQKMFLHLKKQFKKRSVEKEYVALTHGQVARDTGFINFPILRSRKQGRMSAVPITEKGLVTEKGREALTEFDVLERFVNFTLLKVKIHTGRTHQIRAHFLAYNHPLVGDPIYFNKKLKRVWDKKLGRLFLHSARLGFVDLSGNVVSFESPLPKPLKEFLTLLA